ncbi:MAG: signal peptidase I [Ktedonobacterales bacterium]
MNDAQILPPGRADSVSTHRSRVIREIIETVVLTLLIFFAVHFSVQPFRVNGPSMQPNLYTNNLVMVNLLAYDFGSPQRGDVIVFHPPIPNEPGVYYVKRIIAIPGDTVKLTATAVYVDGKKLNEPYIRALGPGGLENFDISPTITLHKDQYWVMGDNRTDSTDSRVFGPISRSAIVGKAEVVIWPINSLEWLRNYSYVYAGAR